MQHTAFKRARERAHLSVSELARLADVNRSTIQRLERGRNVPNLSTIERLERALGLKRGALLREIAA